jgi:hypothetical protein
MIEPPQALTASDAAYAISHTHTILLLVVRSAGVHYGGEKGGHCVPPQTGSADNDKALMH